MFLTLFKYSWVSKASDSSSIMGHGDIGAVVCHPLKVGEQIVEHEALTQGTHALLQAVHMVQLQLVAQARR